MKILALELSTSRGSIALICDGVLARSLEWPNDRRDSAPFFRGVDAIVQEFGPAEMIVVGLGPGSYAGTRIAISTAIGLQNAWRAKLVGYPSICALAVEPDEYWAVGDARRESFFLARIKCGVCSEGPTLCARDDLETRLAPMRAAAPIYSSDDLLLPDVVPAFPAAKRLATLALRAIPGAALPPLEPMYLREPHITQPKHRTR